MNRLMKTGLLALAMTTGASSVALAEGPRGAGMRGVDFETLDRTGDGLLTAEDVALAAEARFAAIDTDGDGQVTEAEFLAGVAARSEERAAAMFARLDADGDGVLSRDVLEARGQRGGGFERMIERFDADGDGGLSAEEFETARAEMREHGRRGFGRNR